MTLSDKIALRLRRWPAERVFGRFDFLDLGPGAAVGMALKRMQDAGAIRRVRRATTIGRARHPVLGTLGVSPEEFAAAVSRRTGERLQATNPPRQRTAPHRAGACPADLSHARTQPRHQGRAGDDRAAAPDGAEADDARRDERDGFLRAAEHRQGPHHVGEVSHLRGLLKPADCRRLLVDLTKRPPGCTRTCGTLPERRRQDEGVCPGTCGGAGGFHSLWVRNPGACSGLVGV